MKSANKIEFGDFQTPRILVDEVCRLIRRLGETADVVLEPTVGQGSFLCAAAETFPQAALRGYDINPDYVQQATCALAEADAASRSRVTCADFFNYDWETELAVLKGRLLLLGNPPWVTNSGVALVNGTNLPTKENFLGLRASPHEQENLISTFPSGC
jgi:methylase of polypeptide subunit release factors